MDLILGLPGETVDSFRRGLDYLERVRPFPRSASLPSVALARHGASSPGGQHLGLEFQPRPPYYVLRTPTLEVEQMRLLMAETQEAFGVEYDAFPPPRLEPLDLPAVGRVDFDRGEAVLPPAGQRRQAFTLWLGAGDFSSRQQEATELVRRLLTDNPHTTLQVVIEPTAELRGLDAAALESLLAACHASNSYSSTGTTACTRPDCWARKRLVVAAPAGRRDEVDREWIEAIGQCATLVWCNDAAG